MNDTVKLMWTGGWDSTFRLLCVLLKENKRIKPYYLIRGEDSTGIEIQTMIRIRGLILRTYPKTKKLMYPITFIDSKGIVQDPEIEKQFQLLSKDYKVNEQYKLIANFCKSQNIYNVEIGVININKCITESDLFERFSLPILNYTKVRMAEIVKLENWNEIMSITHFCRRPKNGKPCGFCGPCTDALLMGMGYRLPITARVIARIQLPFRVFWRNNYKYQNNLFFSLISKILKGRY